MNEPVFLTGRGKLAGADAVAALLVTEDGHYVMQLRDPKPEIFYPDHWGCFGGAMDPGESPRQTLARELREELEFEVGAAAELTRFDFDFRPLGGNKVYRIYYEVPVTAAALSRFVLHEGAQFRAFSALDLLSQPRVTPYDAFAVWLHCQRERFR